MNKSRFVAGLLWLGIVWGVRPQTIPDDYGNDCAGATLLPPGSNSAAGIIDYDTDVDVFSVPFQPWRSYVVQMETGTVWDLRIELIPPDSLGVAWESNTAWSALGLRAEQTNMAAASRWYFAVSGLFRFTTGSYHFAVWEAADEDTDADGIADRWEYYYFGNLTAANATSDSNGDGFLDIEAYRAGLSPDEALEIALAWHGSERSEIGWVTAPYATYVLRSAEDLSGPWLFETQRLAGASGGFMIWTNTAPSGLRRFYRIEIQY